MPDTEVDMKMESAHNEVFEEYNCLSCANCCKTTSPIVEPMDIDRMAHALGIKPVEFKIEYLVIDEDGDYVFHQAPCPFLGLDNKCKVYESRPKAC
ncbi:MAG: YkgJ family cysteine cluster protein, partial [Flavobacteriales bacterium]|nr:YkgJ family cysteine cluster protein [Flavobacteriales bacterium]